MRLVQFISRQGERAVGVAEDGGSRLALLDGIERVYDLAQIALDDGQSLVLAAEERVGDTSEDYAAVAAERRLLAPLDHPDPAHCLVTGTGLTHLGSADARDSMHRKVAEEGEEALSDSMKMFKWGLEGGKPAGGGPGVAPEWFYKGDGSIVTAPEQAFEMVDFAEDGGDEAELVGLYLIDSAGRPRRLGFALGNEFSDHVLEQRNYLYLAHSKLRPCAFGPELRLGDAPGDIRGSARLRRAGEVIWEKPFATGEANMSHSIANLEHHHFKYPQHRRPGDVHVHYFGAATLSFTDGIRTQENDVFEIEAAAFGRPLRNPLIIRAGGSATVEAL